MAVTDLARRCSVTAGSGAALVFATFALALVSPSLAQADCGCGSTDPLSACMGRSASYEVGGSTIEFQFRCDGGDCRCGQFANQHDYWVAPSSDGGTVTITGMTPAQTGSGSGLTNGAVADPSSTDHFQGWNGALDYDGSLTVKVPYVVNTSSVGRPVVLMKASSHSSNTSGHTKCNDERMCLEHVEALTIVPSPPGDAFRPPYFGTEKPMIPASRFDMSVLPSLAPTGKEDSYASALSSVTSVAVDHMWLWTSRQLFHPKLNYGTPHSGYDGYVTQNELGANLTMLIQPRNAAEAAQRELLARRVAQRGIDLYYIFKNGGQDNHPMCGGWFGTGGFGTGRLPTILISTTLLGMQGSWGEHLDQVLSTTEGRQCFSETALIQPPNPRGKNVPLFGHITTSVYSVGSGSKTAADPRGLVDGGGNAASACVSAYQACCTSAIFRGGAMAMWLVPAVMERFPAGAAHWLQFVDRTTKVGAYCSADSFETTSYTEHYAVPGANELYSKYRACSENYSCAGMSNPGRVSNPGPPLAPVLLD